MQFGNMYSAGALDPTGIVKRAIDGGLGNHKFDSMVGTGLSGALVIPALAHALDRTWAILRKEDASQNHSGWTIEGVIGKSWIFVDDLTSSGATYVRVRRGVKAAFKQQADFDPERSHRTRYVGAWLYRDGDWKDTHAYMGWDAKQATDLGGWAS